MVPLAYAFLFFSVDRLTVWGVWLFLFCGACLGLGLLPYRRLCRLEENPHALIMDEKAIAYLERGVVVFIIPLKSIQRISYFESTNRYGILFWLTHASEPEASIFLQKRYDQLIYNTPFSSIKETNHIFIAYFTQRGYNELRSN